MGDIHAAPPSQQEFAADGRHGVEQFHPGSQAGRSLGGHQAGGAAANDGDVKGRKAGMGHGMLEDGENPGILVEIRHGDGKNAEK
ncbi:hypothetical protein D3C72_2037670 [compost metagenome]